VAQAAAARCPLFEGRDTIVSQVATVGERSNMYGESPTAYLIASTTPESERVRELVHDALWRLRVTLLRADDVRSRGHVSGDVFDVISRADIVIADITGANPNSIYELGVATGMRKPVLTLIAQGKEIPIFDIAHLRFLSYKPGDTAMLGRYVTEWVEERLALGGSDRAVR
jgi:hypothetical protein